MMLRLLDPTDPSEPFPDPNTAETEPDGLLAVGGDLSPTRLLNAYRNGIFPWYSDDQPILWWSPDPRLVLLPDQVHVSRSLRKTLRRAEMTFSVDKDFAGVIRACARPRYDTDGTWITGGMIAAYERLHALGHAHSVEVWRDDALVGGLYGIALGGAFFGESMFSRASDASKVALVALCRLLAQWRFALIDCQVQTDHLEFLGARPWPRSTFIDMLKRVRDRPNPGRWMVTPASTRTLLTTD